MHPLDLPFAGDVPAFGEPVLVVLNVLGKRMQREMRRMGRQIKEKGSLRVIPGVLFEKPDGVIGDRGRAVVMIFRLGQRDFASSSTSSA